MRPVRRADNLTTFMCRMSWNLGASPSWNPQGLSRPVMGLLIGILCRSQWPRGLRRRSAATRLLRSWVRIPPGAWMFVCCVFSGRGLCDELITCLKESYRLWCVVVCDLEISRMRRLWPALGLSATEKKKKTRTKHRLFVISVCLNDS